LCNLSEMPTPYRKVDDSQKGFSIINFHGDLFDVKQVIFHTKGKGYMCMFGSDSYEYVTKTK